MRHHGEQHEQGRSRQSPPQPRRRNQPQARRYLIRTLRKIYGRSFAAGYPEIEKLSDVLRQLHVANANQAFAQKEIERILRCQGLVLVFPTWWYGMPAILKGYFDRVWVPGVAFEVVDGRTRPLFQNIVRFAVVTTYGSPWWHNKLIGDPSKQVLMRGVRHLFSRDLRTLWLAKYGMDFVDHASRDQFLKKVKRRLRQF